MRAGCRLSAKFVSCSSLPISAYHSYDTFTGAGFFSILGTLPFVETTRGTTKEEFLVHFHDFIGPELVGIEYVSTE